jgi:hypothetical protein
MASDSPAARSRSPADALDAALGVTEARLDALKPGEDSDTVAVALAEPIQALNAAAKQALR